jgi:hypothetical protein
MQPQQPVDPSARLLQLTRGALVSQAISVAATLGVSDQLASGPRTAGELAAAVDAHPPTLQRILRALCDLGVYQEVDGGRFALAPVGELLRSDRPDSLRSWTRWVGQPFVLEAVGTLLASVRTGESSFDHLKGRPLFEWFEDHPEASGLFDDAMTELSRRFITPAVLAYDFGWASTVVDVAGGRGALLAAILCATPRARGVLYDLPAVVAGARGVLDEAGVGDRCELVAGDFFESVPSGADVYVLANIVHDWDDERAERILANCRAAMADGGRVLLCESLLPDAADPSPARLMDLNMLVTASGGRQRTRRELAGLLAGAGLELAEVMPGGIYSLVVAAPA